MWWIVYVGIVVLSAFIKPPAMGFVFAVVASLIVYAIRTAIRVQLTGAGIVDTLLREKGNAHGQKDVFDMLDMEFCRQAGRKAVGKEIMKLAIAVWHQPEPWIRAVRRGAITCNEAHYDLSQLFEESHPSYPAIMAEMKRHGAL